MFEMKKIFLVLAICFCFMAVAKDVLAGNCDYPWQTASDGSRCGGRSAISRPGGNL